VSRARTVLASLAVGLGTAIAVIPPAPAGETLAGTYAIEGWDAGQDPAVDTPYRGIGTLEALGQVYVYKGAMDGHDYAGVGIYDPERRTFGLHFREDESGRTGVAQYRYADGVLTGRWAWMDDADGTLGKEIWTAQ
jgi:hypothetical protein